MIDKTFKISVDELEIFRYCPVLYGLSKVDKKIRMPDIFNPYMEAIKMSIDVFIKNIFITSMDPREKDFLNIVLHRFDIINNWTAEEKFLKGFEIEKMLKIASKIFHTLDAVVLDNVILHPVSFDIHLGLGDILLTGRAYPIIKYGGVPSLFYFDYKTVPDRHTQVLNLNLAAYRIWLHDNFEDIRQVVYLNLKKPNSVLQEEKVDFSTISQTNSFLTNLAGLVKENVMYVSNPDHCENCVHGCMESLKYLTKINVRGSI